MEVMDKFVALVAATLSQVYSHLQTRQAAQMQYVQLWVCGSHLQKVVRKMTIGGEVDAWVAQWLSICL